MSLALHTQIAAQKLFEENKEIVTQAAIEAFPNELPEHAYTLYLRKYINDKLAETIGKHTTDLIDHTNSIQTKDFADMMLVGVLNSHRYLQNEFWNSIIHLMKKYSELDSRHFDARNENARKMCAEIVKNWL